MPRKLWSFQVLNGLVGDEVAAGDVDSESERPFVVGDVAGRVARDEDACRDADGVEPAVGDGHGVQCLANACAIGDVGGEADRGTTAREAAAGDSDAETVLRLDLRGGGVGCVAVEVDADDVCTFLREPEGSFAADARARADDDDDLTGEFLLGGHALKLGFLEQPVLDVESFLLGQGDVAVDGFGATHDFDGAVVEFSGDSRFRLVACPMRSFRDQE